MPAKVLLLGEGQSPAYYLQGALQTAFEVDRVYSTQTVAEAGRSVGDYGLFVLSDYPATKLADADHVALIEAVWGGGAGLLMIGGWASFGGPRGSYHGSRLAEILPVEIGPDDDRTNTPLGTVIWVLPDAHPAVRTVQGQEPCIVCGFNAVAEREGAKVLVEGQGIEVGPGPGASLWRLDTPMLSVWQRGAGRVAALAPDMSPHWAGGIVDWGSQRIKAPTGAEIGHLYVAFLVDLCTWLLGERA